VVEIVGLSLGTNFTSLSFIYLRILFFFIIHPFVLQNIHQQKNNTHAGTYLAFFIKEKAGDSGADSGTYTG